MASQVVIDKHALWVELLAHTQIVVEFRIGSLQILSRLAVSLFSQHDR